MSGTNTNGSNYGMALLEMLQTEQKEARQEYKDALAAQRTARAKLLQAQQDSQACDGVVNECHSRLEASKTSVRTAIESMSR